MTTTIIPFDDEFIVVQAPAPRATAVTIAGITHLTLVVERATYVSPLLTREEAAQEWGGGN